MAGCAGNSDERKGASGLVADKPLEQLTATEVATWCDWSAAALGGYGFRASCASDANEAFPPPDRATCEQGPGAAPVSRDGQPRGRVRPRHCRRPVQRQSDRYGSALRGALLSSNAYCANSRNRYGDACVLTVSGSDVSPVALAWITMLPAVLVERTMASALPLKALRLVPL